MYKLTMFVTFAVAMSVAACGGQSPTDPNSTGNGEHDAGVNMMPDVGTIDHPRPDAGTTSEVDSGVAVSDPCTPFMWADGRQVNCRLADPIRTVRPTVSGEVCKGFLAPKTALAGVLTNDPTLMPTVEQPIVTYLDPQTGPRIRYRDPDNGMTYSVECEWM